MVKRTINKGKNRIRNYLDTYESLRLMFMNESLQNKLFNHLLRLKSRK